MSPGSIITQAGEAVSSILGSKCMIFPIYGTFNLILTGELDQTLVLNEEINHNSNKPANLSQHISSAGRLNSFSNPNLISQLIAMYSSKNILDTLGKVIQPHNVFAAETCLLPNSVVASTIISTTEGVIGMLDIGILEQIFTQETSMKSTMILNLVYSFIMNMKSHVPMFENLDENKYQHI